MKRIKVRSKLVTTNAAGEKFWHPRNKKLELSVMDNETEVLDFLESAFDYLDKFATPEKRVTCDAELSYGKEYYTLNILLGGGVWTSKNVDRKLLETMFPDLKKKKGKG